MSDSAKRRAARLVILDAAGAVLVRTALTAPGVVNSSTEAIVEHRWWTIPDLETTNEVVYPEDLANRVCRIGLAG